MSDPATGIVIGIVSCLDDEQNLGRVKVRYPNYNNVESDWIRIATLMAGNGRGSFFVPEVGDEVLVGFEHGCERRPYILGALWNTPDPPPTMDSSRTDNNWRFIQSRSGHIILLDDTPGQERIVLVDKDGQRRVVIDSGQNKIVVQAEQGNVEIQAPSGQVLIEANEIVLRANTTVTVTANQSVSVSGNQSVSVQGGTVSIN